ncbi:MAG: hypothetical protein FWD80_03620 [Propionibacteriaceae bacterium]|nr:hypothetical protein [Propionibacteriaceae bacterium]
MLVGLEGGTGVFGAAGRGTGGGDGAWLVGGGVEAVPSESGMPRRAEGGRCGASPVLVTSPSFTRR